MSRDSSCVASDSFPYSRAYLGSSASVQHLTNSFYEFVDLFAAVRRKKAQVAAINSWGFEFEKRSSRVAEELEIRLLNIVLDPPRYYWGPILPLAEFGRSDQSVLLMELAVAR